ncbi:MAG: hypothetical protein GX163_11870 [Bacteroidetes bacterium]|nr:hypothetical protein [Bacteroidota bacterium]
MNLKGKKLLLLGGSRNMKEILDVAHDMGVWVGVTDWYDTKRSPVKLMADEYFDTSIEDYDGLIEIISTHAYDGVLTGYTDSYLLPYAETCKRAKLPCYGTSEQFEILTDKIKYKQLFRKYGVPTLPEYKLEDINENFTGFPLLLKPTKGSGGKGLVQVYNYPEFLQVTNNAGDTEYLIEPYIDERKELTAFFLFVNGEIYLSGTANRFLSNPQGEKIALPILYSMPSSYDRAFRETTAPPMIKMFKDLGLKNGILFAQCIVDNGVSLVYDIGYRLTGSLEYKLQEKLYGFNPLKMLVYHSLTGNNYLEKKDLDQKLKDNDKNYGFNVTILGREGSISKIEGENDILSIPEIIDCTFKLVEGESITESMIGTLGQIIARIFFVTDSIEAASDVLNQIYELIYIYDQDGEEMILDRFTPEQLKVEYYK